MGRTELDDYNEASPSSAPKDKQFTKSVTWDDNEAPAGEAVCAVCDALFTPTMNRPPIFCPDCKAELKKLIA